MALLRRRLRCHYCNVQSRDSFTQTPSLFLCPHCDAVNHFDEHGNITDPPADEIATAATTSFNYRYSRSPSPAPAMPPTGDDLFCDTCQRNQTLLANILAEYLPDEDHPQYEQFVASYDAYKSELEDRYPQVCQACLPRVQQQIRNAGYAAKADHLRRIMDKSDKRRRTVQTPRQTWTLRLLFIAKWTYIASLLTGMLWHAFGLIMAPEEGLLSEETFQWQACLRQAVFVRSVDKICLLSPYMTKLLVYALVADLLTIWWNPKLEAKTNSLMGRMRGLKSLWSIRIAVFLMRCATLYYWTHFAVDDQTLKSFRDTQFGMLIVLALSCVLTWKSVRIVYHPVSSLQRSDHDALLSAPKSVEKSRRGSYHPAHLIPNVFDSMAHSFTSGFEDTSAALPPSPTLTASSISTHFTDATTPYTPRTFSRDDGMDWTPTQRRFAQQTPNVLPPQWSQKPSPLQQKTQELHSLFSKPDPNPFHHKIPAAPKAPAQATLDPWKPGVWNPPLKDTTPNFFKEDRKVRGQTPDRGLEGLGVPRNVKRDAEMFASPKLKYDYYGTMKDTGLEDTFNGLFSK